VSQRPATPPSVTSTETQAFALTQDVRKTVLDNGLTVLTKEVHTAPVVTVQVWYKIGSRNEAPGVNGIAHQLEHMLFKGTKDRPIQFGRLFSALGSASNAFTSYDQTAYYGTVEREKLKALLVLEADRMQNSLIEPQQLETEKRVVISELQGYENSPNYRLNRAVMRAVFPDQPYGLPVGGTKADVQGFTVEQVRDYYRKYYSPENATLIIVGDFQTEPTLAAVKEIFGKVPSLSSADRGQTTPTTPTQPPTSKIQNPIVLREEGSASFMQEVYPLPSANHPDVPALDVMDYVLTGGRNSRLYQALVESGIASDLSGGAVNLLAAGWYELSATATPGQKLEKIEQVIASQLAQLKNKGVTDEELKRAKTQLTANVILGNRDITSQAMQLGYDELTTGDYRFTDRYLAAVQNVSAADVRRVGW
jgi:zinc protease